MTRYYQDKTVKDRTSCRRAPRWVRYEISCDPQVATVLPFVFWINAQCVGFSKDDCKKVRDRLNPWLKSIEKQLP